VNRRQFTDSLLLLVICNTAALGMMLGADISVTRLFFQALLPATMGNLAGGGLLFTVVYWYAFLDSKNTTIPISKKEPDFGSKSDVEGDSSSKSDVES
jgi:hypothetical protein